MRIFFILLILLTGSASAEVYKHTNPDGSVVFTDVPKKQQEEPVPISPPNTFSAPPVPEIQRSPPQPEPSPSKYTEIFITSPADDVAIRSNTGTLDVEVSLKPALMAGHKLILLMDGEAMGESASGSFTLDNVDRGSHTLSAQVQDTEGETIIASPPITTHLLRFSALQ